MRRLAVLIASSVLLLSGCGSSPGASSGDPEVPGTGRQADYDFTAQGLDGGTVEGTSLEGRTVVLWFWAPWCPTCRAQIPNVSALVEQYPDDVAVVGVGGLDEPDAIADLAGDIPDVTHVVDDEGEVWRHFGVTTQSSYVVIDADGEIVLEGYVDDDDLNELVASLVAEST